MWQEDKPEGLAADTLEEGWNTIGLVAAGETDMNGWWWRDERRQHTWGVHDSMRQAYVSISSPLHQVQPSGAPPVSSTCTTCTAAMEARQKRELYAHVQQTCSTKDLADLFDNGPFSLVRQQTCLTCPPPATPDKRHTRHTRRIHCQADRWARGASFGDNDRVGLLVDMDERVCHVYVNQVYQGVAFRNLPAQVLLFAPWTQRCTTLGLAPGA